MSRHKGQSPMTPEWRAAISFGVRRAWADKHKRKRMVDAIRRAHDDPSHQAAMRERFADRIRIGSRREAAGEYDG